MSHCPCRDLLHSSCGRESLNIKLERDEPVRLWRVGDRALFVGSTAFAGCEFAELFARNLLDVEDGEPDLSLMTLESGCFRGSHRWRSAHRCLSHRSRLFS